MTESTATAVAEPRTAGAAQPVSKPHATKYTRNQPFLSRVLTNHRLTGPESEKETIHIEL